MNFPPALCSLVVSGAVFAPLSAAEPAALAAVESGGAANTTDHGATTAPADRLERDYPAWCAKPAKTPGNTSDPLKT
jgi:hypothetical protein